MARKLTEAESKRVVNKLIEVLRTEFGEFDQAGLEEVSRRFYIAAILYRVMMQRLTWSVAWTSVKTELEKELQIAYAGLDLAKLLLNAIDREVKEREPKAPEQHPVEVGGRPLETKTRR